MSDLEKIEAMARLLQQGLSREEIEGMSEFGKQTERTWAIVEKLGKALHGLAGSASGLEAALKAGVISMDEYRETLKYMVAENEKDILQLTSKTRKAYEELNKAISDGASDEEIKKHIDSLQQMSGELGNAQEKQKRLNDEVDKTGRSGRITATIKGFSDTINGINAAFKTMVDTVQRLNDPWAKITKAGSDYAKSIGMSVAGMKQLRDETMRNVAQSKLATKYNVDTTELLKMQQDYVRAAGRNIRVSNNEQEYLAAMHSVMGGREGELISQYEKFGVSLESIGERTGKMFADASKNGVAFEKYSDNVAKNMRIAQNYTFRNGLKGLESMAMKATALRLDMQQVAAMADKVSSVEGSIDVAAKLQVLGGPFAAFADPMGMLNEGLNDMEGLQDRIAKMVGNLGTFNRETGEVEVSAFNKQRIRAAAEAMGMDYSTLMESVNAQARRGEIEKQMSGNANVQGLSEEMRELIKNTGTFKDGKAGVSINGKFKSLDELSDDDYNALQAESRSDSENIKDIAVNLRDLLSLRSGVSKQKDTTQARMFKWLGGIESGVLQLVGSVGGILVILNAMQAMGVVGDLFGKFGGKFGKVGKWVSGKAGKFLNKAVKPMANKVGGKVMNTAAGKYMGRMWGKVAGKAAGKAAGEAAGAAAKKAVGKTVGKKLLTSTLKSPKGMMGAGTALSIAGSALDIWGDSQVESGKWKKGTGAHNATKVGGNTLAGAGAGLGIGGMIALAAGSGSAAGPIGAIVGAVVGATIGIAKAVKNSREAVVDAQLSAKGIERQGKYSARKLKLIDKALQTGEASDKLRRRLLKRGDMAILDEINRVKERNEEKELRRKEAVAGKGRIKMRSANISVGTAVFSGGGFDSVFRSMSGLRGIRSAFRAGEAIIKGKGLSGAWEAIKERQPVTEESINRAFTAAQNAMISQRGFNINLNGTLRLTSDNGQSVDIISQLRQNPQLLRSLADMISREISYIGKGTNVVQKA